MTQLEEIDHAMIALATMNYGCKWVEKRYGPQPSLMQWIESSNAYLDRRIAEVDLQLAKLDAMEDKTDG